MNPEALGLYLHIPFCVRKCAYCDFLSFALPGGARDGVPQAYVERLGREIEEAGEKAHGCRVDTVFFGGGTPSLLSAGQLQYLCGRISACFRVAVDAEWSLECNPGTVDGTRLARFREAGINRLSIGLQSACDGDLRRLGRVHTWEQFLECFREARRCGFANLNVDLMSALPGQTAESYREGLQRVAQLSPEHISAYSLILEEGTPLYEQHPQLTGEEEERRMYEDTKRVLVRYGYHRYEISNYAKEGRECVHNRKYWTREAYLGLGLGASSFYGGARCKNTECLDTYLHGESPLQEGSLQRLSPREGMEEFMFLGLRLTEGVSGEDFRRCFGVTMEEVYGPVLEELERQRLVARRCGRVRLTDYGIDVSNYVFTHFLLEED